MAAKHHARWVPGPADGAVAAAVGPDVAFLPEGDGVVAMRWARRGDEPRSPVLELVRAVWATTPARAHATLRHRIRLTSAPAPFDADVVRVAARRWALVPALPGATCPPVRWLAPPPEAPLLEVPGGTAGLGEWVRWASSARRTPEGPRATADRPVVAVLVAQDGAALAAAHNQAGLDRSAHAEVALLRGWWARSGSVPPGATLVTTLQCCRMCAALWASCAPDDLVVVMAERDPGPFAQGTRLALRERLWGQT